MEPSILGGLLALTSAVLFGGSDFTGGYASRRHHELQVVALVTVVSVALMGVFSLLWREPWPSTRSILWAAAAGIIGALGLVMLYRGLAMGHAAIVSPTAGVIGAALPVVFGAITKGWPGLSQSIGFVVAVAGIWMVTRSNHLTRASLRSGLALGLGSGVAFGLFFVVIAQVETGAVFLPLMFSRVAAAIVMLAILRKQGLALPRPTQAPLAALAAMLDSGGNVLYLISSQMTRVDVAAVLTSLYPAGTVLLSRLFVKEPVSRQQWVGVLLCLLAATLIVV